LHDYLLDVTGGFMPDWLTNTSICHYNSQPCPLYRARIFS
jgi:hypothetical protein